MFTIDIITDLEECRRVWEQAFPRRNLSDLWEVRACFQKHYHRPAHFVVARDSSGICGLLPLSWVEESQSYAYFPGETWEGHTWLEQNRILARNGLVLTAMLQAVPGPCQLRYLLQEGLPQGSDCVVDEIGYIFVPALYGHDMSAYFQSFSHKSAKRIRREVEAFQARGVYWRLDDAGDYPLLVEMNRDRFGDRSYFADARFARSFSSLMQLLDVRGWLRMTTALVAGEPAAVDMGSLYNHTYTLLAGGTSAAHPGVAKLINLFHMERACRERIEAVDFLCGSFSWKEIFHLTRRPLYVLEQSSPAERLVMEPGSVAMAEAPLTSEEATAGPVVPVAAAMEPVAPATAAAAPIAPVAAAAPPGAAGMARRRAYAG